MAGVVPATHTRLMTEANRSGPACEQTSCTEFMGGRDKPGHDVQLSFAALRRATRSATPGDEAQMAA